MKLLEEVQLQPVASLKGKNLLTLLDYTSEEVKGLISLATQLKTITKDQICYVDLSKEFLNPLENISGEVTVYAIVNSLAERAGVNKVQFTVNGKPIDTFRSNIDFTQPIGRNLDLIKR